MMSKPSDRARHPRARRASRTDSIARAVKSVVEPLEGRRLLASLPQFGGVAYLPNASGTQLERYDVTNERWLAPITLAGAPGGLTASLVDADGIYAAFGTSVIRYSLDGATATPLATTTYPVREIHADGNLLFANQTLNYNGRITSINKTTNAVVATRSTSLAGSSILPGSNRIVGRSMGFSPTSVTYVDYNDAGQFVAKNLPGNPYSDQSGTRTWASPSGAWFVDDSGTVYSPTSLDLATSFGTRIDDLTFTPTGAPVALYGGTLTSFASQISLRPTGFATLAAPATWVVADADDAIAFRADAATPNGYAVQVVPLADFALPQPGTPVNATDRVYAPDDVEVASDGTVLLLSNADKSVFRFDPQTLKYLPTISLLGEPSSMTYVPSHNAIYVGYASGRINQIDLSAAAGATPAERPFATLAGVVDNMIAAGGFLFTANRLGRDRVAHSTFSADGTLVSFQYGDSGADFAYSPTNGKLYLVNVQGSPAFESVELNASGKLGTIMRGSWNPSDLWYPVSVAPDGTTVLTGNGSIFDATTLLPIENEDPNSPNNIQVRLGNRVAGITRSNGDTYTIRDLNGGTQFQRWTGSSYAAANVAAIASGTPLSIQAIGGGRLLGVYRSSVGVPVFRVMDANLQTLAQTTPPPPAPLENATIGIDVSRTAYEGSGFVSVGGTAGGMGFGQSIVRYDFDFDYDGATFDADASAPANYHVDLRYSGVDAPSTRTIAVRATDTFGQVVIRTGTVTFVNLSPTATFTATANDPADRQAVVYSFASVWDASAADVAAGFKYSFDFNNDGDFDDVGDVLNSTSPTASYRWATIGTYTVRGRIMDKDGGANVYTTSITVSDNTNVAAGKPTTASGNVAGYPASNATDGNPVTEWLAPATDQAWLQVDLGSFYRLTSLIVAFNAGVPSAYQVQTSTDGATWTTRYYSASNPQDSTANITLPSTTTSSRYVRLLFTQRNAGISYRVGDLRVFGLPGKPPVPTFVGWDQLTSLNEGSTASLFGSVWPLATGQTLEKWEWDFDYDGQRFDVDATGRTVQLALLDSRITRNIAVRGTDNFGQVVVGFRQLKPTNVAPSGTFAATSAAPGKATATFSSVTDPSAADAAAGFSYSFDFNNDGDFTDPGEVDRGTSPTATGTFYLGGTYTVVGYVFDRDDGSAKYAATLSVAAPAKPAMPSDFGFVPIDLTEGEQKPLVGRIAGLAAEQTILKWEYDFDYDCTRFAADAAGQTAYFDATRIDGAARRKIGVRVTDNYGQVATTTQTLTIANAPPTAQFGLYGVYTADEYSEVKATFSLQTDVSEADATAGFRYAYDFNADGDFTDPGDVADTASPTWTRVYPGPGLFYVIGRITDKDGGYATHKVAFAVYAPPGPRPKIYADTVYEGQQLMVYGTASNDAGKAIVAWDWDFDYVAGAFSREATGQNPLFDARDLDGPTSRSIALRVTDEAGRVAIATSTVNVLNAIPYAGFAFAANANGTATATFSNVTDVAADVAAGLKYSFDFNHDGDFDDVGDVLHSSSPTATYTPAVGGTVIVNARVTDKDGGYLAYGSSVVVTLPTTTPAKLTGAAIGTAGSFGNSGNTVAKAFDGSLATYVDLAAANGGWAGLDLGAAKTITSVRFAPRGGWAQRMVGGAFQASTTADFSSGVVTLATVTTKPAENVLTTLAVTNANAYRYVRYLSPSGSYGNVAEVEFFGQAGTPTPPPTEPPPPTAGVLSGVAIGTAGSFGNSGNTVAKAFDGSLATYVDLIAGNGGWAGLDLGTAKTVTSITYAPRVGWAGRMVGGLFQASATADFSSGVVTLATVTAKPAEGALTTLAVTNAAAYRYVRYLSPAGGYGNVAEVQFVGGATTPNPPPPTTTPAKLMGSTIGTAGSFGTSGNTIAKALDGSLSTYVDLASANGGWVGLDLGAAKAISSVRYAPRVGWAGRMVGGLFQASNVADFSSGVVTLATVTAKPAEGVLTTLAVTNATAFRYVRYLSPSGGYGNVAEVEFLG